MNEVELVKSKIDIVELISEYMPLKKAGRNFKGNCPFHGEKTPSFMVNPELQIFKCFGCQKGGDVFTFLQGIEGMEFGEALKTLAKRAGVTLTAYKPDKGEEERERLININTLATQAYNYLLTKHKLGEKALAYVKGRGINEEDINTFKLGYAPDQWRFLEDFLVRKKGYKIEDLVKAGLSVEGKNYDRFRNRIMFPLNNSRGQTVGFAGREMPGTGPSTGSGRAKYINSPETAIYHKSDLLYGYDLTRAEIKKTGRVIVVEGEIDMIASFKAGVRNVVAIKGSAFTAGQVELLRRVCETVVLALDADLAGNMAARRGIELAEKAGLFVETVDWSQVVGKDVADIAMVDPEAWKKLVDNPISIYSFLIDLGIKRFGLTPEGKTRIVKDVLPVILTIEDTVRRDEYLKELASKIKVDPDVLREKSAQNKANTGGIVLEDKKKDNVSRRELTEEYVVGVALRSGKVDLLVSNPVDLLIKSPFWQRAVNELRKDPDIKKLPNELKSRVEDLMLLSGPDDEAEWKKALSELEEMDVREKMKGADLKTVVILSKRLGELTKEL